MVYLLVDGAAESFYQQRTDNYVNSSGHTQVLNDYTAPDAAANGVRHLFNVSFSSPVFAIINGVANSPGHNQWELLVNKFGYPSNADITGFRTAIDAVQAPVAPIPPSFDAAPTLIDGQLKMTLTGTPGSVLDIEITETLNSWSHLVTLTNTTGTLTYRHTPPAGATSGFFRARLR